MFVDKLLAFIPEHWRSEVILLGIGAITATSWANFNYRIDNIEKASNEQPAITQSVNDMKGDIKAIKQETSDIHFSVNTLVWAMLSHQQTEHKQ